MVNNDIQQLPKLEVKCGWCRGDGHFGGDTCPECNGTGYAPTELGKVLIEFMTHQMPSRLKLDLKIG